MLKAHKDLVVVGDYHYGYYNFDGYDKLKQKIFDENENNCSNIKNLYKVDDNGEVYINQDVYDELLLSDIDSDIQQVLIGDDIVNHLVDDEPDDDGYYTCRVSINGGWDYVKIPSCCFDEED